MIIWKGILRFKIAEDNDILDNITIWKFLCVPNEPLSIISQQYYDRETNDLHPKPNIRRKSTRTKQLLYKNIGYHYY